MSKIPRKRKASARLAPTATAVAASTKAGARSPPALRCSNKDDHGLGVLSTKTALSSGDRPLSDAASAATVVASGEASPETRRRTAPRKISLEGPSASGSAGSADQYSRGTTRKMSDPS